MQVLQLLVELLAQTAEFIGVAQVFGVHLFIKRPRISPVDRVAVGVGALTPRLWAAGPVIALGDGGFFLGLRAVIVGGLAFHFLGLRAEHGVLFGFGLAFAVLGVVLRAGLLAAIVAVFRIVVWFGIDLGFREVQGGEQLPGRGGRTRSGRPEPTTFRTTPRRRWRPAYRAIG